MSITYDPSVDILRIILEESDIDESDEEVEGIIMDYNASGKFSNSQYGNSAGIWRNF